MTYSNTKTIKFTADIEAEVPADMTPEAARSWAVYYGAINGAIKGSICRKWDDRAQFERDRIEAARLFRNARLKRRIEDKGRS